MYQSSGHDHTLGIGYKSSSGTWSANGTSTISYSGSAEYGRLADANIYNAVNYRDTHSTCGGTWRRPIGCYGLSTNFTYAGHINYPYCQTVYGGTYTKNQGRNTTYANGVNIGGFSVSAQSGWNREVRITWTITARSKLCGSNSVGWLDSAMADTHQG